MEKKQIIPPGTRWGSLTYIKDLETDHPKKRPLLVMCDCGTEKQVDLSQLRQNPMLITCGSTMCRRRMQDNLNGLLTKIERDKIEQIELIRTNKARPYSDLKKYWDLVETGQPHLVAEGMRLTREVIGCL